MRKRHIALLICLLAVLLTACGAASSLRETRSLAVSDLSEETLALLDQMPMLEELDARECSDYPALAAFLAAHPQCRVLCRIPLGDTVCDQDTRELRLEDPDLETLSPILPLLTSLETLTLSGDLPEAERLLAFQADWPQLNISWTLELAGRSCSSGDSALDLSGAPVTCSQVRWLLDRMPGLRSLDLRGCGLTEEALLDLTRAYPQCFLLWEKAVGDLLVPTDTQRLDLSHQVMESPEAVEELLTCFPRLEWLDLSFCGLSNEELDALNRAYPDVRIVWTFAIRFAQVRTDATFFYPYTFWKNMQVNDEEIYPLRYCTDLVAIDIGHMTQVTNCEWAAFLPNLKYLVIGETNISDLTPLSHCKSLVYLEMFTIPATDYSPLVECTALEDLNLGNTFGSHVPIGKMTWLKNLWWSGIAGTVIHPCSKAPEELPLLLPNTTIKFQLLHATSSGWRQLPNYYAMRDCMGMFYLS